MGYGFMTPKNSIPEKKHGVSTVLMALPNLDAERNQVRISHLLQHSLNVRVFQPMT